MGRTPNLRDQRYSLHINACHVISDRVTPSSSKACIRPARATPEMYPCHATYRRQDSATRRWGSFSAPARVDCRVGRPDEERLARVVLGRCDGDEHPHASDATTLYESPRCDKSSVFMEAASGLRRLTPAVSLPDRSVDTRPVQHRRPRRNRTSLRRCENRESRTGREGGRRTPAAPNTWRAMSLLKLEDMMQQATAGNTRCPACIAATLNTSRRARITLRVVGRLRVPRFP